ncbi:MAG: hypothetical protein ACUVQ0_02480 [Thermoproteota archaeon]
MSNPVVGGLGGLAIMLEEKAFSANPFINGLLIIFIYSILPFFTVYYLRLRGKSDTFMSERARRPKHFIPGLIGYALSAIFFRMNSMVFMSAVSTSYFITSLLLLFFTFSIKISIHVAGLASTVILLIHSYGYSMLILLPSIPVLAWARIKMKEHTCLQTTIGAIVGIIGSLAGLFIALKF